MERVAARSVRSWLMDAGTDVIDGWGNFAVFGLVAWGLFLLACCGGSFLPTLGTVGLGINLLVGVFASGIGQCALCGVALARLHGREAESEDFQQDMGAHLQAVMAVFLVRVVDAVVLMLACAPGAGLYYIGHANGLALVAGLGVLLAIGLGALALAAWRTLVWFVIPLIVDRQLDFWSAFQTSVDCARRDYLGLLGVLLLVYGAIGMVMALVSVLTLSIALVLLFPLLAAIQMRAYRDYFGIEPDRYCPVQVTGFSSYGTATASWTWERAARTEQLEAANNANAEHFQEWREREQRIREQILENARRSTQAEIAPVAADPPTDPEATAATEEPPANR